MSVTFLFTSVANPIRATQPKRSPLFSSRVQSNTINNMTSPISISALVVVIIVTHATISAAVPRTNRHQDLTEAKIQGSLSESRIKPVLHRRRQHRKPEQKHRKKSQNIEKTSTKGHGKKHRRKSRRKDHKSEKGAKLNKSPLRKGKQSEFDDFRHCDYLDLVEVG